MLLLPDLLPHVRQTHLVVIIYYYYIRIVEVS